MTPLYFKIVLQWSVLDRVLFLSDWVTCGTYPRRSKSVHCNLVSLRWLWTRDSFLHPQSCGKIQHGSWSFYLTFEILYAVKKINCYQLDTRQNSPILYNVLLTRQLTLLIRIKCWHKHSLYMHWLESFTAAESAQSVKRRAPGLDCRAEGRGFDSRGRPILRDLKITEKWRCSLCTASS